MYVYLLRSKKHPKEKYIGTTDNVRTRLRVHNAGESPHTAKYKPWKIVVSVWFEDTSSAVEFERYLKIGSGHAFANRHFW